MATVSNTRVVNFGNSKLPDLRAGWTIRILDYKDMASPVAVISEYTSFSFTQELSATGQGSLSMDQDSPFWTRSLNNGKSAYTLKDHEYVIEAWDRDTPRFAWLAQTVDETIVGDDETRVITFSGPGIAQVLAWAPINRPGWPTKPPIVSYYTSAADGTKTPIRRDFSYSNALPAYKWQFPTNWATMKMWYIVFRAAQARGLLKFVSLNFTAETDSKKKKWEWVNTQSTQAKEGFQPTDLNQSLLEFLNDCTGQDYTTYFGQRLEWLMNTGFHLTVQETIGQDRTDKVRFFSGNILSDQRTRVRDSIFTRVIAVDVDGNETTSVDKTSVANWNLREQRNETAKQITDDNLRASLSSRYLKQSKDQKDEWTLKIAYDDPNRVPYRHFFVGDTIGFTIPEPNETMTYEPKIDKFRVLAITISVSADSLIPECELTLRSMLDTKQNRIQQEITKLVNAPSLATVADIADVSIPKKPDVKSALVYNPETKKWEAAPTSSFGGGGGGAMYVQKADPAAQTGVTIAPGTFWLETYD